MLREAEIDEKEIAEDIKNAIKELKKLRKQQELEKKNVSRSISN
jgi:hypothetical protein